MRGFLDALGDEGALRAPLYPLFLAAIARLSTHPAFVAMLLQSALAGAATAAVFYAGTALMDRRAGLLAASLVAVWPPFLEAAPALWSEHLHVPLIAAAFAIAAYAINSGKAAAFGLFGAALGAAALARAMPLFYVPIAIGILAASRSASGDPRTPTREPGRRAVALAVGFLLVSTPYILAASFAAGSVVPIETEGTMGLYRTNPPGREIAVPGARPAGAIEAIAITARQFAAAPTYFTRAQLGRALRLFSPGWWFPADASQRVGRLVSVLSACMVLLVFVAAPFGWKASRDRTLLHLLAGWIAVTVVLVPLSGNTGARYRAPIDPAITLVASAGLARRLRSCL